MADRPVDQQKRATVESLSGMASPRWQIPFPGAPPHTRPDAVEIQAGATSLRDAITLLTGEVRRSRANVVRLAQPADALPFKSNGRVADRRRSRVRAIHVPGWMQLRFVAATVLIGALFAWFLLNDIGSNPAGLFCDEAEIGIRTRELIRDDLPSFHPRLFYSHLGYEHLGALPLYAGAPVVAALGLSDMSVRLASGLWFAAALVMLVALVRRLGWRNGEIAVVLFGCTPIFIHLSRVNFGHGPSLFGTSLGLYAYVRGREEASWRWSVLAGFALAAAIYGEAAYYIAAPIVMAGLAAGEVCVNGFRRQAYRPYGIVLATFCLGWVPVIAKALTDSKFLKRFQEKDAAGPSFVSAAHARDMLANYPKYFDLDYLFRVGETGLPGGWNLRSSVPGAGILTWMALPLVVAGIIAIFRTNDATGRVVAIAGVTILILYPVPDLITTTELNPPYTYSVFTTLIFVPLLAALGIHWLSGLYRGRHAALWSRWILPAGLLVIILGGAVRFYTGPYERYPMVSTGYYGWQYGAGPVTSEFKAHRDEYDRFLLDPEFNEAYVFLDFYLADDPSLRNRAQIGSFFKADLGSRRRELYAVRADKYDALMSSPDVLRRYTRVIDIIRFPSGEIALYMVEVGPQNDTRPQQPPF